MRFNIKIEVWEKGNDNWFTSAEKYFNSDHENDFNKEVELLKEQVKGKINENATRNENKRVSPK